MKIAIFHDYLLQRGGAEKSLQLILKQFPKSNIYTLFHDKTVFPELQPKVSFLQPFKKHYKTLLPFLPIAVRSLKTNDNSLIISSSHSFIKNIKKPKNSLHICYCYTPMRYAWNLKDEYLINENPFLRPLVSVLLNYLRHWDKKGSKNVDYFIAISKEVQRRIKKFYNRSSVVIYPPVETKFFELSTKKQDYYFLVSRLIEYKKVDLAIEAFKKLKKRLIIAGSGRDEKRLKKLAEGSSNIIFKGRVSDDELRELYQNAKAFVFPQLEDFGITAVESQSCGTPVIAYAKGGALETVIEGKTGHFFHEQTPESLINAVHEFEKMSFNPKVCRENALKYDKELFKKKIKKFVEEKYSEWKAKNPSNPFPLSRPGP